MLARIWRTEVDPARLSDYERFAREKSLPMFRRQAGLVDVFFLKQETNCAVITIWEDEESIEALARSATYRQTVREIEAAGFLRGAQSVEVYEIFEQMG
ncbi:MAG TPA: hypothetical protein VHL11_22245 [Phototrophicaceae bacterium]|jgi:heme-degrading monooxygenase HmoA|nr:hypothetical protein [Phototrophicaceae bacterium]